ncbi:hypothetical protein NQ315_003660 [Exocentrus adspersus]|uniref:THAP-type domain-containing protein n=1 Tax=Exocentrus adspersus TaxID=1586481 RepID=A0AAV8V9Q6_9CUCU|nr:hypothetical protein NQ315_003660 [Exocentrus adspersus]
MEFEQLLIKWGLAPYINNFIGTLLKMKNELESDGSSTSTVASTETASSHFSFEPDEELFEVIESCVAVQEVTPEAQLEVFKIPETPPLREHQEENLRKKRKLESQFTTVFSENLENILEKTPDGKLILKGQKKLTNDLRQKLVKIVINDLVAQHMSQGQIELKSQTFVQAAQEIIKLFPSEQADTYYIPYCSPKTGLRQPARGKLWSRYVNVKAALRLADLPPKAPLSIRGDEKENVSEESEAQLAFLKIGVEPYTKVLQAWQDTHSLRRNLYKNKTLDDIYENFPCLKTQYGIELHASEIGCSTKVEIELKLLEIDFNLSYPDKIDVIYTEWPKISNAIIKEGQERNITLSNETDLACSMTIIRCCVPGCGDMTSTRHRFPNPKVRMELFKVWLAAINNEALFELDPLIIYENRRICHRHFEENHFSPGSNRVHHNAIPTLFLPGVGDVILQLAGSLGEPSSQHTLNEIEPSSSLGQSSFGHTPNESNDTPQRMLQTPSRELCEQDVPSTSSESYIDGSQARPDHRKRAQLPKQGQKPRRILKDIGVTSSKLLTPRKKILYGEVKALQTKLRRNVIAKKNFRRRLFESERFSDIAVDLSRLHKAAQIFFQLQLREAGKLPKQHRFTQKEKILCLALYKKSPKMYKFLSIMFVLPSKATLNKLLNVITFEPGINEHVFRTLEKNGKKHVSTREICVNYF